MVDCSLYAQQINEQHWEAAIIFPVKMLSVMICSCFLLLIKTYWILGATAALKEKLFPDQRELYTITAKI